jgi:hypothetical protein
MKGSSSNKGWHQRWFYLRSDANAPLPPYTAASSEKHWSARAMVPLPPKKEIDSLF